MNSAKNQFSICRAYSNSQALPGIRFVARILPMAALLTLAMRLLAETPPAIQWQKGFGGNDDDRLHVLQPTSDGGYFLGGASSSGVSGNKTSTNSGPTDYWVLKLDASGEKVLEKTFGRTLWSYLYSVEQTDDGGYLLGGMSHNGYNYDYWVVRLDASGNKIWDKSFGGSGDENLYSVQQTGDGGYILGGFSSSGVSSNKTSPNYGAYDFWVLKLDANGNKVWERSYGGNGSDWLYRIQQTTDGGYILGGPSSSGVSGNKASANYGGNDYWVVKLDAGGDKVWDKSFGGNDTDWLWSLEQTDDGGYILGGASASAISGNKTSSNYGGYDFWIVKLDADGNKVWETSFGGSANEDMVDIRQTGDGGYILGGFSNSGASGNKSTASLGGFDYWLLKLDHTGVKDWEKSYGGSGDEFFSSLRPTKGGFILGGYSTSGISGNKTVANFGSYDYWVLKLGSGAPVIVVQPQSRTVTVGDSVTFNVVADGAPPLTYQWLFDGTNIVGATGPTLTFTNTTYAQAGFYSVTVSNQSGVVTSADAQLLFNFLALRMYAGLTVAGEIGQSFRIEYLPALGTQHNWRALSTVTLTSTPFLFIDVDSGASPHRFYRALLVP